jgi:hypothetical protein
MKTRLALLLLLVSLPLAGCVQFTPEQRKAHFAPLASTPDIVRAATLYRVVYSRWPAEEAELRQAFALAGLDPASLETMSELQVLKKSDASSVFTIRYKGGGRAVLELNAR